MDWLIRLLRGIYHGVRCVLGAHEWVQDNRNAKWDRCRHCGLRTRAIG